jgi:hypothetical protein
MKSTQARTKRIRPVRIDGELAYVTLSQGHEAVLDAVDVGLVVGHNWHYKRGYAVTSVYRPGVKKCLVFMHRLISGTPAGMETDHIDGDGLNNRRSNLRFATTSENQRNRVASANNTSGGRKGVNFHRYSGRWRASIQLNGKRRHLGYFDTPDQAHAAYCESAVRLHGDFVHESIRCHAASDQKKAHRQVAARSRPSPPHTNTEPARMPAED